MKPLQLLSLTFTSVLCFGPVYSQSATKVELSPKAHFEKARTYDAFGDPRAEEEYRRAIAASNGVYPEAWRWLSSYLSQRLRFNEAERALKTGLKQSGERVGERDRQTLKRLKRAADLKARSAEGENLSSDEMVELVKLIDQYGKTSDAAPYAERAVTEHPTSAKALMTLASLIRWDQRQRAIVLLNQAVSLEPGTRTFIWLEVGDITGAWVTDYKLKPTFGERWS